MTMLMSRCGDYDSSNPVHRSLDLVTAIKVAAYNSHVSCYETMPLQASTIPPVWGEMTVTSIGRSFMEYSVQVEMNRARQGAVLER